MKATINALVAKPVKAPAYPRLVEAIPGGSGFSGGVFLLLNGRGAHLGSSPTTNNAIRLRDGAMATITPEWYQDYKGSVTIEND